jgi:DNA-binding transcriptional ArsR family regulator
MFEGLITSKMRVRILMRLFLNPQQQSYIRELAEELYASPSQVSDELKNLGAAGLLISEKKGRQVRYRANPKHPLYPELHSMVGKALGMDRIIESILQRLGNLEKAIIIDDYAMGKDTGIIDLVLIGNINQENLADLVKKTEKYINRKIRTLILSRQELKNQGRILLGRPQFVLWEEGK